MSHRQRGGTRSAVRQDVDSGVAELIADPARPDAWTLLVDGAPQSHVDLDDPGHLEFGYVRRLGYLIDLAAPAGQPLRVLHLGGGGLTLARYVAATRPGSSQLAVESDAALVELVRQRLPLRQPGRRAAGGTAGRVRVRVGDARAVLEQLPPGSFDVVIADLFAQARTPAHFTSAEFTAAAARALGAGGRYAANVADGPPLAHARGQVATVRGVFPHACLVADTAVLRGRKFGNLVLAGSGQHLPVARLSERVAGDQFRGAVLQGAELDRFAAGARQVTDAQAAPSIAPPAGTFSSPGAKTAGHPGQRALRCPAMYPDTVSKVQEQLKAAGAAGDISVFPEPVPTAAAAAAALGCDVGAIANSLVFEADGAALLVLASGAHRVHTGRLAERLGTGKIRRATPDFVLAQTGQQVGGVAPVGHPVPLRTVVDQDLAAYPVIWAGAGDENAMFATSFAELVAMTSGTPAAVD